MAIQLTQNIHQENFKILVRQPKNSKVLKNKVFEPICDQI